MSWFVPKSFPHSLCPAGSKPEQFPVGEPECEQYWELYLQGHCGGLQGDQNRRQVSCYNSIHHYYYHYYIKDDKIYLIVTEPHDRDIL